LKPEDFDLRTGVASVYWELEATEDPLDPERDFLREDLIQITFERGTIVDVGWHPEFRRDGSFGLVVIQDQDWESPIHEARCRTLDELRRAFEECLALARANEQRRR
jgi:hypothetical protein